MADYWISFRINSDAGYNNRYNELTQRIEICADGGMWDADTSFVCIRSKHDINTIGQHLKAALNTTSDHLVIREIGVKSTRYINNPGEGFLAFFPEAKKL